MKQHRNLLIALGVAVIVCVCLAVIVAIVFVVSMFVVSRGSSGPHTPPHYGVFLKMGGSFVEMQQYEGGPPSWDDEGIPTASDSQPLIVMWYPEVNLDLLVMESDGGQQVSYDATPTGREGILEIRPETPLDPGVYCLAQGNPMLPAARIPIWCFRVP